MFQTISPIRRRAIQREYQDELRSQQRESGPLALTSTSAVYMNALNHRIRQRNIQAHIERIRQSHQQTQERVTRITRSLPTLRDTDKIPQIGNQDDPDATITMPAIRKRQEQTTIEEMARVKDGIDYAINRFIGHYGKLPRYVSISAYNRLILSLEGTTVEDEYTNMYGTYRLVLDYDLPDTTIICEEE